VVSALLAAFVGGDPDRFLGCAGPLGAAWPHRAALANRSIFLVESPVRGAIVWFVSPSVLGDSRRSLICSSTSFGCTWVFTRSASVRRSPISQSSCAVMPLPVLEIDETFNSRLNSSPIVSPRHTRPSGPSIVVSGWRM
jgi:hypothetical protein